MGLSGYDRYDRYMSNADVSPTSSGASFPGRHTLDAGCALGFVVEALRELDLDAEGVDVSFFAVDHASPGTRGHVRQGSLLDRLPFDDADFDVVTALETLEHLPPESIPAAIAELRTRLPRLSARDDPVVRTERERPRRLVQRQGPRRAARALSQAARHVRRAGSVRRPRTSTPRANPLEGHLTIASFGWWTKQFEAAGFERCGDIERRIHPHLARFGLTKFWSLYVFRVPGVAEARADVRSPAEIEALEDRWGLNHPPQRPRRLQSRRGRAQPLKAVAVLSDEADDDRPIVRVMSVRAVGPRFRCRGPTARIPCDARRRTTEPLRRRSRRAAGRVMKTCTRRWKSGWSGSRRCGISWRSTR